ncbi:MAG: endo-1,4-beta-xylanase [Actinomycetota bacterium]|nr:endo-1,4-beta-xylanase [Actinomycetota bacterium]
MRTTAGSTRRRARPLRAVLVTLAMAIVASSSVLAPPAVSQSEPLRELGPRRQLLIGAAAEPQLLSEAPYAGTLSREFGALTPRKAMKWEQIHPERHGYDFTRADILVDFAERNAMQVRGHPLVWHMQNPPWLYQMPGGRDEFLALLREHIFTVVGRYRGRVAQWDVVNEAVDASGNLGNTIWLQKIGPDYIEKAFQWAHEADPSARLYYNEFAAEGTGAKSDGVYNLVRDLRARGVPVHGVGLQMHITPSVPAGLDDNLARLQALGLDLAITEMDVRLRLPPTEADLQAQAAAYHKVVSSCLAVAACRTFATWGFTDKYSWIPETFPGYGAALPFDENYNPKPAYHAIQRALAESLPRVTNPGFERYDAATGYVYDWQTNFDYTGWGGGYQSKVGSTGSRVHDVLAYTRTDGASIASNSLAVAPGQAFRIQADAAYVGWPGATHPDGFFLRAWFGTSGDFGRWSPGASFVDLVPPDSPMPSDWRTYGGDVTVPSGVTHMRVVLYNWGPQWGANFQFDNVAVSAR